MGERYRDASLLAMAGESLTHVTSWDYYEVRPDVCSSCRNLQELPSWQA